MTMDQLLDWYSYMLIHPLDPSRDDYRTGLVAAQIAELRGGKPNGDPVLVTDMIQSPIQMIIEKEEQPRRLAAALLAARDKVRAAFGWGPR